ncbi:sulfotransferase family protein [Salinibacter ruber]|uniref:sulfotransferase family protein n=1 Tax=Salinibacter ruber TaxID=146919 RepID=UPI002169D089|nr:sulfotransferase [Salinibacter ruber]MCS3702309.1 hypothetical protein [Salinibacter ruber]
MDNLYFNIRKNINACFIYDSLLDAVNYIAGRRPLRRSATNIDPSPFFIVGSGRSGNTLLRAILTGHSNIAIPPESYVLGKVVRRFKAYSFLGWKILLRIVLSEFEYHRQFSTWDISLRSVYHEGCKISKKERGLAHILDLIYRKYIDKHMPSAVRWGDKTPVNTFHLDWIDRVFPKAKYVHMVRDGRDVVSSYLRSEIYSNSEEAADRWKKSIEMAKKFEKKRENRFLKVRYEELVRFPNKEVRRICDFLDVEFKKDMLKFKDNIEKLGDTHLPHHRGLKRPINTDSIGKWKERLTDDQKDIIRGRIKETLSDIGYTKSREW